MLHLFPSDREPAPPPLDPAVAEQARALGEQQLQTLTTMAEIGLALAQATLRRAQAEPAAGESDGANFGLVYSRIARAVRMTIALQSKVMAELIALDQRPARAAVVEDDRDSLESRRRRVDNIVNRVIAAEHDDQDTVDQLQAEAWERLDDDDIYGDLTGRPMGEIVALICQDLRLSPDWTALAREAWAVEEGISPQRPPGSAETAGISSFTAAPIAFHRDLSG